MCRSKREGERERERGEREREGETEMKIANTASSHEAVNMNDQT
jgi:hypothetical protein